MLSAVTINRVTGDGKYGDVLDVIEELGKRDLGNATNAAAVLIRQSPLFQKTKAEMEKNGRAKRTASAG